MLEQHDIVRNVAVFVSPFERVATPASSSAMELWTSAMVRPEHVSLGKCHLIH